FDWGGARLHPERDRAVLGWVMNQFLYGEVTGIQCGHWLYDAPDLDAARFFARQAVEAFQHVDNFLRILDLLGEKPGPPRRLGRFLERKLPVDHPVLHRLPEFLDFALDCGELRLRRMGIVDEPLQELSVASKAAAVIEACAASVASLPLRLLPRKRLTETYLRDPAVSRTEQAREKRDGSLHIVR